MNTHPTSILVIERHPMLREALCAAIEAEENLSVLAPFTETGGGITLSIPGQPDVIFLAHKPDIVLLAIGNPGLEDMRALQKLHHKWHGTPILALTSDEVPGQEQTALAHGAKAALSKSASRSELLKTLRSLTL